MNMISDLVHHACYECQNISYGDTIQNTVLDPCHRFLLLEELINDDVLCKVVLSINFAYARAAFVFVFLTKESPEVSLRVSTYDTQYASCLEYTFLYNCT
jgi:hypothetical protein